MLVFEIVLGLLLGATVLSGIARRLNIPYPTLLALGGALLAFVPGTPRLDLPPTSSSRSSSMTFARPE
jgi:monovalent cation/hydrogen antiporter